MRRTIGALGAALLLAQMACGQQGGAVQAPAAAGKPLTTVKDRVSYGFGLNIGRNLTRQGVELDFETLARGLKDGLSGSDPAVSEDDLEAAMAAFQKELRAKEAERRLAADPVLKATADRNKKDGDAFLAANGKKPGVVTTKSGLQYEVMKSGTGKTPKATDTVRTHYHGTLVDGKVFDSSVDRKEPATFPVNGVISGWTEALQLMKVGDKWRLTVPSELAYGLTPRPGGPIGPNAVLVFEVELLAIEAQ